MYYYQKIGNCPKIDGRQGDVLECREEKSVALAKAVAELMTANLHNNDG